MADNAEPDDPRLSHQPTYFGFNWYSGCTQLGERDDVWYLVSDPAVVSIEDWSDRLYTDVTDFIVACRVRTSDDARVPGIQFLQFHCDCLFRSGRLWYGSDVDL